MTYASESLSFTYNDEGIRTSKTVNGVTHYYSLEGSQILSEEWTESGVQYLIIYQYDVNGQIMGMSYRNSTYSEGAFDSYLFTKNLQGDIIYIYDESGNKVVTYLVFVGNFDNTCKPENEAADYWITAYSWKEIPERIIYKHLYNSRR